MKNNFIKILILQLVCTIFMNCISAQVKTKFFEKHIPDQLKPAKKLNSNIYQVKIPAEFSKLKLQKSSNEGLYRYALPVIVDIDLLSEGSFSENKGVSFYFLTIKAGDAMNLSVNFSDFRLTEHAILTIFTEFEITDSINSKENNENHIWGTRVYQGNELHILLQIPSKEINACAVRIKTIYLGYKNFGITTNFGNPGGGCFM